MLTNEEKEVYYTKVNKQVKDGFRLQTMVLTCSKNCQELQMQFKMTVKNDIIKSYTNNIYK